MCGSLWYESAVAVNHSYGYDAHREVGRAGGGVAYAGGRALT